LDPLYSAAHNNLANILYRDGNPRDAISHYQTAVSADPSNAEAHCAYARVLTETSNPRLAIDEYRAALATRPDWVPCLINFSWLVSAHEDASIRAPQEAVGLAERAATLTNRQDSAALDALAAAYAAAGRFDDAVGTGSAALALARRDSPERAGEIRSRLE